MKYALSFDFCKEQNCGVIYVNEHKLLLDTEDLFKIINHHKTFTCYNNDCIYPYYVINKQKISYLRFLFNINKKNINYIFVNKNIYDLRRKNIEILHKYHNKNN